MDPILAMSPERSFTVNPETRSGFPGCFSHMVSCHDPNVFTKVSVSGRRKLAAPRPETPDTTSDEEAGHDDMNGRTVPCMFHIRRFPSDSHLGVYDLTSP